MCPPSIDEIHRMISDAPLSKLPSLLDSLADDSRAGVQNAVASGRARLKRERAERSRLNGLYRLESQLRRDGSVLVAGVDEVGRGALAGPITAAAVILPASPRVAGLDDSKRLLREKREKVSSRILSAAVATGIAHVGADQIDSLGMTEALRRAMIQALEQLGEAPDHVLVDGRPMGIAESETAIIKGDSAVAAIAAASVIAKVSRDALMRTFAAEYPQYGFDINKGYGTREHMEAIARCGLSPIHRRSFGPCGGTIPLF